MDRPPGKPVEPVRGPLDAVVEAVPSKSVTHRALIAAALARGTSVIRGPLLAEDSRATRDGLRSLGIEVRDEGDRWIVEGGGGVVPGGGSLQLGESGTSLRLLLAVAALGVEKSRIDGASRLRQRPLHELAHALVELGGYVRLTPGGGGLPLEAGGARPRGGAIRLPSGRSSQFASALLLVAPVLEHGIELELTPPVVSLPYVELTAEVLQTFSAKLERRGELRWRVHCGGLSAREYRVEGDHSAASYFLAAAAIVGGRVRVTGVDPSSRQPDARLGAILEELGCEVRRGPDWVEARGSSDLPGFDVDVSQSPDLAPTLAALTLFAEGPCVVRGAPHLRLKESDRLEVLASNLRVLGAPARVVDDRLEIDGSRRLRGGRITTASDHRIAMAFALAAMRIPDVVIDDTDCVAKSNPRFWSQLDRLVEG